MSTCDGVSGCPFLRTVSDPADVTLLRRGLGLEQAGSFESKGPLFADGMNFDVAFKMFHGDKGVIPLNKSFEGCVSKDVNTASHPLESCAAAQGQIVPDCLQCDAASFSAALSAAPFASIGLSSFGGAGGMFGFDAFRDAIQRRKMEEERQRREEERSEMQSQEQAKREGAKESHEALGEDWLATGNCPIARSYRAFSKVIPAVAAAFKPPAGVKYVCPPAIVALRAAVAKHPTMQALRPQALPIRVLAIGTMGLFLNVPLGAWREHLEKFSPQWILVVHASVPFVALLRKAALMPKYAMAFTIAASIIGQTIGSRMERKRVTALGSPMVLPDCHVVDKKRLTGKRRSLGQGVFGLGQQSTDLSTEDMDEAGGSQPSIRLMLETEQ